jgi:nucleoside-diphosphate-sugar epimerase
MRVLVTGANGLLGTHVIQQLLEKGYPVNGLLRNKDKFLLPEHTNLELIEGDLRNQTIVKKAVKGCDAVIHCAAITAQNLIHYNDYYETNVLGTKVVLNVAIENNIKKIVYVSSANTLRHGTKEFPGNEQNPARKPFTNSLYAKSKREAEELLLSASHRIDVVIVNPSFLIGAYDSGYGSGRIIRMGYGKRIIFCPPGGKNFVNAADAADGIIAALEKGTNTANYLLTGENLTYAAFFTKLIDMQSKKPLLVRLPSMLLLPIGAVGSLLRYFGVKTAVSFTNMQILCTGNYYSNQKAINELGIGFEPIENGITEAVDWFKHENIL